MILTSNVRRAGRFGLLITASSNTGLLTARRREAPQRRTAKAFTVAHFQALAFDARRELQRQVRNIVGGVIIPPCGEPFSG